MREMVSGEQDKATELQVTIAVVTIIPIAINLFAAASTTVERVIFVQMIALADTRHAARCCCGGNE